MAASLVSAAGFIVGYEHTNGLFRVAAINIDTHDVARAVQRLGAMGFRQIWVRR
ncbi:MAG: hypothetical protein FWG66_00780 [Spirochaetes bacterium]|nr:hypothetical protein [Spirochaetota bacterium]